MWTFWELWVPLIFILLLLYLYLGSFMYDKITTGVYRKKFKEGNIVIKIFYTLLFVLYLPYLILNKIFKGAKK